MAGPLFPPEMRALLPGRYIFPATDWLERDSYYQYVHGQGGNAKGLVGGYRATASALGKIVDQQYGGMYMHALVTVKLYIEIKTAEAQARMDHGTRLEAGVRERYSQTQNVHVTEVGLCIPKWDTRLGAAADGEINEDGIIEIKCPQRMYESIEHYMYQIENKKRVRDDYDYEHIVHSQYLQMQMTMKVMNKKWCNLIVYASSSAQEHMETVLYNPVYWEKVIAPALEVYLDSVLDPLLLLIYEIAPAFLGCRQTWAEYSAAHDLEWVLPMLMDTACHTPAAWATQLGIIRSKCA